MLSIVFDNQDRYKKGDKEHNAKDLEEVNLGIEDAPKEVCIGKKLSPKIRKSLIDLPRKYKHIFSWLYDDLKTYMEDLFQHKIPLKDGAKNFRQKKRPINPNLAPKMQEAYEVEGCKNHKTN